MSVIKGVLRREGRLSGHRDVAKIAILTVLVLFCMAASYAQWVLRIDIVFTHFFYVPIVIAGFWWGKRAIWVAGFLGAWYTVCGVLSPVDILLTAELLRSGMFVVVGVVVATLRERRTNTERTLQESEEKHRSLLENLPQKIFYKDTDSVYISCNENYARDLNIKSGEITGKTDYDFYPKELADKYRADDKRLMTIGKTEEIVEEYVKDGQRFWVRTVKCPVRNENGRVIGIQGIFWDITEHKLAELASKRAEESIKAAREYATKLIDSSLDMIISVDQKRKIVEFNRAAQQTFGYSKDEVLGKHIDILYADQAEGLKAHETTLGTGRFSGEIVNKRKNGELFPSFLSASVLRSETNGELLGVMGVSRDITERKRAEEALSQERDRAQKYLDIAGVMIVAINAKGEVTLVNRKGSEILGYEQEEIIGKDWCDNFVPVSIRNQVRTVLERLMAGEIEPVEYYENVVLAKGGEEKIIAWHNAILNDDEGHIIGTLSSGEDITHRKRMEEALQEANARLKILQQLTAAVHESLDPKKVFDRITEALVKSMGFSTALIFMIDDDREYFRVQSIFSSKRLLSGIKKILGFPLQDLAVSVDNVSEEVGRTMPAEELAVREHLADIAHPPLDKAVCYALEKMGGSKSFIFAPLVDEKKLIGGIVVTGAQAQVPPERLDMLRLFARSACQAVVNVRLHIQAKQAEEKYRELYDEAPVGYHELDQDGKIVRVNKAEAELLGHAVTEMMGKSIFDFISEDEREDAISAFRKKLGRQSPLKAFERKYVCENGTEVIVLIEDRLITSKGGKVVGIRSTLQDITEQKQADEALRESEERYHHLFDNANDLIQSVAPDGRILYANKAWRQVLGYSVEEIPNLNIWDIIHPDSKAHCMEIFQKVTSGEAAPNIETLLVAKDGSSIYIEGNAHSRFKNGKPVTTQGIFRDITERKQAEEQIKASLKEKEALLKEVHHRVKNNMQIITSLLNLQSRSIGDQEVQEVQEVFTVAQNRVKSMALVHEKLYQSESLANIDFAAYVRSLTNHLVQSYEGSTNGISVEIDVDGVELNVDTAIPCGLIINELVSNSLKHAFSGRKEGKIVLKLIPIDGEYVLTISDNGVGLPKDVDYENTDSLGLQLVNTLTSQLEGTVELKASTGGTSFRIVFRELR